jgi:hypothetical protein
MPIANVSDGTIREEWENLAKAVEAESGERIEWRTDDEIAHAAIPDI